MNTGYSIKVAARRSGLSPHLIRAWESRYGAVTPRRTDTNRRLYSDGDIERLALLRQLTDAGHAISHIAERPNAELIELLEADAHYSATIPTQPRIAESQPHLMGDHLKQSLGAVSRMDEHDLERAIQNSLVELGQIGALEQVLLPLMQAIGERWRTGELRAAHEHLASAVVRGILDAMRSSYAVDDHAPALIITTPSGQLHEFGALMVAAAAAADGWRVIYLGPSLPAEEIALAARTANARAIALSIVYPSDDPKINDELRRLKKSVNGTSILVGGRGVHGYLRTLHAINATTISDLDHLKRELDKLREQAE